MSRSLSLTSLFQPCLTFLGKAKGSWTYDVKAFVIMTLCITTLSLTTLSITVKMVSVSITYLFSLVQQ
jgi:hypothetical protein